MNTSAALADPSLVIREAWGDERVYVVAYDGRDTLHEERAFWRIRLERS